MIVINVCLVTNDYYLHFTPVLSGLFNFSSELFLVSDRQDKRGSTVVAIATITDEGSHSLYTDYSVPDRQDKRGSTTVAIAINTDEVRVINYILTI